MNDERVRQGATFEVTFTDSDTSVETLTITVSDDQGIVGIQTVPYIIVDSKPTATIKLDTSPIAVGEYKHMYTIVYEDSVVKLPNTDDCDDEEPCELPAFVVCEANDIETS